MSDLNFFEVYLEKPQTQNQFKYRLIAIIVILCLLTVYPAIKYQELKSLNRDIIALEENIMQLEETGKIQAVLKKQNLVKEKESELNKIQLLEDAITKNTVHGQLYMESMAKSIPDHVFLTKVTMLPKQIQLEGVARNQFAIAQFQHNLNTINIIEKNFIPSITERDKDFIFSVRLETKEEQSYETEPQ